VDAVTFQVAVSGACSMAIRSVPRVSTAKRSTSVRGTHAAPSRPSISPGARSGGWTASSAVTLRCQRGSPSAASRAAASLRLAGQVPPGGLPGAGVGIGVDEAAEGGSGLAGGYAEQRTDAVDVDPAVLVEI